MQWFQMVKTSSQVGDIVIIYDKDCHKIFWKKAINIQYPLEARKVRRIFRPTRQSIITTLSEQELRRILRPTEDQMVEYKLSGKPLQQQFRFKTPKNLISTYYNRTTMYYQVFKDSSFQSNVLQLPFKGKQGKSSKIENNLSAQILFIIEKKGKFAGK